MAGAFLTGGGANMPNISNVFKEVVGIDKVTVRKNSQSADYILPQGIKNSETRFLAALGLIANANQNCTTDSDLNRNMFVEEETPAEPLQTVEEQTADDMEQTQAEKDEKTKKPSVLKSFINKFATISKRITEE